MSQLTLIDTSLDAAGVLAGLDRLLADFDGSDAEKLVAGLRRRADSLEPIEPGCRAEVIYSLYPRKVGRQAALKAIEKAFRVVEADELQAAVEEYAAAVAMWDEERRGRNNEFIPHCSTWMNGGRWADDRSQWGEAGSGNAKWLESRREAAENSAAAVGFLTGPADPSTVTQSPRGNVDPSRDATPQTERTGEVIDADFEVVSQDAR